TLLKILNGVYQPDSGGIFVDGREVHVASPRQAFDSGIAMVFQEQSILPTLTVAENIFLGREEEFIRFGLISKSRMKAAAKEELKKVHLDIDPGMRCADLSFAARQMVEIAKALSLNSRTKGHVTILLDEPTSVLEQKEVDLLFRIIRDLRDRASFVFISHRLEEVLEISDRVYVMRDGKVVKDLPSAGASVKDLHQLMVGRQLHHEYYREARQSSPAATVVVAAEGLSRAGAF
ncbi:MAG: sugar ABC transporter ATP-binding protein, partial [Candidatus Hydrogenedentes bacterium]|nr:sugar ABC transporter ATP-binding protein [Candidatus Hydrogenedentota bacterium]